MKTATAGLPTITLPIILQSKDGRCFRRIGTDGRHEKKWLGMEWELVDEDRPFMPLKDIAGYVRTLTGKLGWKQS